MLEQMTIFDILDDPLVQIEVDHTDFDSRIKFYVMAAIKNMGFEQYFDYDKTEISISSVDTSNTNRYFPKGCAMMRVYVMSDKATTDLMIANQYALDNHCKWVEGRNYDHRFFTKWNAGIMTHRERMNPIFYSLEQHRNFHFTIQKGDTWFKSLDTDKMIEQFYEWGF